MKKLTLVVSCATLLIMDLVGVLHAQPAGAPVRELKVQGNVYMLVTDAGNVAVQLGDQGVVAVDTLSLARAPDLIEAIRRLAPRPLQFVINTSANASRVGGNDALRAAGITITAANVAANLTDASAGAQIIAHENVLNRMSAPTGKTAAYPFGAWPTVTYTSGQKELFFNGESIAVMHQPNAHSDGDSIVYFRRSDVVSAGEVLDMTRYPVIDVDHGGSIQGEIQALNRILELAIPQHDEEGGTYIIPARGRLCDEFDVLEYRDMVVIIRDRVRTMMKRGMNLAQIKASGLTKDYDPRFGAKTGPWTTEMFLEAVYKSLAKN